MTNRPRSRTCLPTPRAWLAMLVAFPVGASAQNWFAGAAIGQASQDDYAIGSALSRSDDSDTSAAIFGGYMISPMQGVVAAYIDMGETRFAGPAFGGFTDDLEAEGLNVAYLVRFAPGSQQRFWIFGTVGVFDWEQEVRYADPLGTLLFKEEGTSFSFGLGASANLSADGSSPWNLHLAFQNFKDVGDANNSGHEYDRETISVGISYGFGGD